ncbi:hypothetical protein COCCADRAFT_109462, partial [Bipolaris zeicola 26-R-13]
SRHVPSTPTTHKQQAHHPTTEPVSRWSIYDNVLGHERLRQHYTHADTDAADALCFNGREEAVYPNHHGVTLYLFG